MFEQFQAIEQSLKIWRGVVLVLSIVMLLVSLLGNDEMAVIFLIICMFALVLFQMPNMPTTSYQVRLADSVIHYVAGGVLDLRGRFLSVEFLRQKLDDFYFCY
jgi:hypothetical protein